VKELIDKMKFVSITGPREEIDKIADSYISRFDIEFESAINGINSKNQFFSFGQQNPYREQIQKSEEIASLYNEITIVKEEFDIKEAVKYINDLDMFLKEINNNITDLEKERLKLSEKLEKVKPFKTLNYDLEEILKLQRLRFRFGRIAKEHFQKLMIYVSDEIKTVFVVGNEDENYIWGVYFVPIAEKESVDAAYSLLHYERTFIPSDVHGTPVEEIDFLETEISKNEISTNYEKEIRRKKLEEEGEKFFKAYNAIKRFTYNFEVRRYAACTKEEGLSYFILCGWMTEKDAIKLQTEIKENESSTICILEDAENTKNQNPPTKLKNPSVLRPFELFVKMYGMPSYNEIDPTIFVALTYAFIFGAMFGDVGQGIALILIGYGLYHFKKMNLGAIIGFAGIFSTFFGFMFGSVFGFEDIIKAYWLHPAKAMVELPFIGKINTVFVVAIVFGMGIVVIAQIMHIINAIREKRFEDKWFDANGVAGLIFYSSTILVIMLYMTGNTLPGNVALFVLFGIPFIVMALKEPLNHLLLKKKESLEGGIGLFIVQTFFEMFEILLSYFSNTLSFLRIGAFAVSHAAMMEVVLMLAGVENGSGGNILIIIIGNIIVCGLEGLVVGIQVLRLEYYEMFSRFYKGTGREFTPYK